MGLFSANYAKEGPGVDKNAPQKKRFFLFWDIYLRKFWKLVQLNLLYFLFYIPAGVGLYYRIFGGPNLLSLLLILATVVLLGPATAGLTYVLRNFAREEHAFVWSDFKENFKSNFKQAAVYGTLFTVVVSLMLTAALFYYRNVGNNAMLYVPLCLCLACLLVVSFMNFYMYTMIVTFRLTLRQMVKNAFIFSIIGVFTNILTFLVTGAITAALIWFFPLSLIFMATFALSTIQFVVCFNVYPRIKKFMIDPYTEKEEPDDAVNEDEDGDARIFSDERLIPPGDQDDDK